MLQPPPGTGRSPGASNVSPSAKRTSEFQVLSAQALTYLVLLYPPARGSPLELRDHVIDEPAPNEVHCEAVFHQSQNQVDEPPEAESTSYP